jgi:hypothetical protein
MLGALVPQSPEPICTHVLPAEILPGCARTLLILQYHFFWEGPSLLISSQSSVCKSELPG